MLNDPFHKPYINHNVFLKKYTTMQISLKKCAQSLMSCNALDGRVQPVPTDGRPDCLSRRFLLFIPLEGVFLSTVA